MPYNVNKKDGTLLVTVNDGAVDDSQTTIKLLGRGVTNYGEIMAENLVWMMENFANTTAPANPLEGQIWFDKTDSKLNVWDGSMWRPIGSVLVAGPTPGPGQEGDLWWDQVDNKLYGWDSTGATWVLIGPTGADISGPFTNTFGTAMVSVQLNPGPGRMILVIVEGDVVAGWSNEARLPAAYAATVGVINVGGANVNLNLPTSFPSGVEPGCTLAGDIVGNVFNGTAIQSQYADIAERYHADFVAQEGDLVKIGGTHEVTKTSIALDPDVFGVVSASPAVRMNAAAGPDSTHPYIGLAGRLPVKVGGTVSKGQRLVSSATPGVARGAQPSEIAAGLLPVFGRALEDKLSAGIGLVESVIGTK